MVGVQTPSLCYLASGCQQMRQLPAQAAPAQKGRVSRKSLSMMEGGDTKSSSFRQKMRWRPRVQIFRSSTRARRTLGSAGSKACPLLWCSFKLLVILLRSSSTLFGSFNPCRSAEGQRSRGKLRMQLHRKKTPNSSWRPVSCSASWDGILQSQCPPSQRSFMAFSIKRSFPGGASGREPACQRRRHKRHRFDPWVGKMLWRRARPPTPVFLPRESPWTEEPGGLQSMGSQRVGHHGSDLARTHTVSESTRDSVSVLSLTQRPLESLNF